MSGTPPLFDAYLLVDWSAANRPRTGADSIWLHHLRHGAPPRVENPATRHSARERLQDWLEDDLAAGRRTLLGVDFALGYPAGFAQRLGLGKPPWRAVWQFLAAAIDERPDNRNDRFHLAAELNRRITGGAAPFWGCPRGAAGVWLAPTHHRRHAELGLDERRISDRRLVTPQPVWKLYGNGSVGSQALTGIPVVERLYRRLAARGQAVVWPFETGLVVPPRRNTGGEIVFAEIYPSLRVVEIGPGEVRDAAQLRTLADYFMTLDRRGALAALFRGDPALSATERRAIEDEEGWILGEREAGPARRR